MTDITYKRILVAVETDATRYHGEHASRPRLLDRLEAEQMLSHISTDLAGQFASISSCALTMAGGLFDQTQLIRPSYPVFSTLESLLAESFEGSEFEPRLLSFGADEGHMPDPRLQPEDSIPLGLLQILPLVLGGPADIVDALSLEMEHRFIESGQVSAHSARALEANFSISVNHARFMTVTDLNAMLHLQLEHFGFLPLWQLLDAAINDPEKPLKVEGRGGQLFEWTGKAVRCTFETFNYWAGRGAGRTVAGEGQLLAQGYADWTREYRQYLTTISAHAVQVEQVLAGEDGSALKDSFLVEVSESRPGNDAVPVTEHSSGDLGTVAVSVVSEGRQADYYPLLPAGLNDLHASIRRTLGPGASISFPGSILYDIRSRRLTPDTESTGP